MNYFAKNALVYMMIVLIAFLATYEKVQAEDVIISTFEGDTANTENATLILKEAYKELGRTLVVKQFPGERALQTANRGEVDGEMYRKAEGIEEAYSNLHKVPVSILSVELMVFTRKVKFPVKGWQSLRPYRVGYMRGTKIIEENLVEGTKAEAESKDEQNFLKLKADRIDIVITSRRRGLAILKKLKFNNVTMLKNPLFSFKSYHYLHKKIAPLLNHLRLSYSEWKRMEKYKRFITE